MLIDPLGNSLDREKLPTMGVRVQNLNAGDMVVKSAGVGDPREHGA